MSALFGLTRVHLCIVLLLILIVPSVDANISDILLEQKKAVVTVYVNDENGKHIASGGGFIIDPNGVIVTNCQVIKKWFEKVENTLGAQMEGGIYLPIEDLISSKCKNNLAMFKVKGKDFLAVKIAGDYTFNKGEDIFVLGSPSELKTMIYDGVVKNVLNKDKLIQISIPVLPEKSGTPVFNMDGEAVAALTFLPEKSKDRQFAVPLKNIVKQLNKYKKLEKQLAKKAITSIPATSLKPLTGRDVEHRKKKEEVEKKLEDANEYFLHGCAYHELNMYQEAIKFYQKALKIKPDFVEAFINLGVAHYKLGQYTEAIDVYKQAVQISPKSPSVYNKLGSMYIIGGKYPMALDTFKKAIDLEPKNAVAHYNLGIAYYLNGEMDAAFKECAILQEIDKERAKSLMDLIN